VSRARRARRIAAAAVFGGGGIGALGAAGYGLLAVEARLARRWIGQPFGSGPRSAERYGEPDGAGTPIRLVMAGDSTAAGLGAGDPEHTPGAVLAAGLAALSGRQVRLQVVAVVGAQSSDLDEQLDRLLGATAPPDVVVIMVGANDVTHRVKPAVAVRALEAAVRRLQEAGSEVVVATCPDLGTIEPIAPPLRHLARRLSRRLAAAQTIAVVEAGGRSVSLGDLLGAEFAARPREMFSSDGFHPSAAGYARAADAMLPSVAAAIGYELPGDDLRQRATSWHPEGIADVAHAAARAAAVAGTEVSGTEVDGAERGPRGRWALLLRRRRPPPAPSRAAGSTSAQARTADTP
jgi:lysophospholipase L1-like esterase